MRLATEATILVVEDDPDVAELLGEILGEHFRVEIARSATEAADTLARNSYDLLLLDMLLPGGGADAVMVLADTASMTTVLMSGDLEGRSRAAQAGRPFVAKPFSVDDLLSVLDTALAGRNLPDASNG
jgi:DNA-binding response OmpR family regulator